VSGTGGLGKQRRARGIRRVEGSRRVMGCRRVREVEGEGKQEDRGSRGRARGISRVKGREAGGRGIGESLIAGGREVQRSQG
jgi:hypothetical protein